MTRFGMKEPDFEILAVLFADAVKNCKDVGDEVAALREKFQDMQYCFDVENFAPFKEKLLATF